MHRTATDWQSVWRHACIAGIGITGLAFTPPALSMLPVMVPQVFDHTTQAEGDEIRNADALAEAYAHFKPLWDQSKITSLSYTLTRSTLASSPISCDGIPVRIDIRHGKLKSATFERTMGECQSGHSVDRKKHPDLVLTAADLWASIDDALAHRLTHNGICMDCQRVVCMHVTFEAETGLPLLIEGGCAWEPLGYWKLEVSNLKTEPAT